MGVVSCATATGAKINMARRQTVARNIAFLIQSSFSTPSSRRPVKPSPAEKVTHSVQNPNVKVSIILTIFKKFNMEWVW
jgi:hypothetical protein